jgi:methylthioribulose-1-phosphate dehydratase
MLGTSGNLSARVPNSGVIVVTASGCDKGRLTPEDFVEVDESGQLLAAGQGRRASAETSIHTAVYSANPEVGAVLHVHTVATTLLASSNATEGSVGPDVLHFSRLEMLKGWGMWEAEAKAVLPVFTNHPHVPQIADELSDWLRAPALDDAQKAPAMLIAHHGVTSWGTNLEEAHRHLEVTEFLCRLHRAQTQA